MSFLRYDSPAMELISTITDMVILNLLCLLCCIPVVTAGAAITAKYYVAMKIVRHESTTVIKPYFRAFKDNFKQSTVIWLILAVIGAALSIDWLWTHNNANSQSTGYVVALGVLSALVIMVGMTIFPFIARFEVKTKEAFKGAVIFSVVNLVPLALIAALFVGSIVASFWYIEWLPLIYLFGTTTSMYFLCITLVKGFKKLEDNAKGVEYKPVYSESESSAEKIFEDKVMEENDK